MTSTFSGPINSTYGFQQAGVPLSQPAVTVTSSTLTATSDSHAGALVLLDRAAGITVTLPAASGTGAVYRFMVVTTVSSNSTIIKVANASDTMVGWVSTATTTAGNGLHEAAGGTDDTITMNGTTTGGIAGSYIETQDVATNVWLVNGLLVGSGTLATSLSASVS